MNENDRDYEARLEAIRERSRQIEVAEGRRGEDRRGEGADRRAAKGARKGDKIVERASLGTAPQGVDRLAPEVPPRSSEDREKRSRRAPWQPSAPWRDASRLQYGSGFMGYPSGGSYPYTLGATGHTGYPSGYPDPMHEEHVRQGHLGHRAHDRFGGSASTWTPRTEMLERGGTLLVRVELPGLERDDVDVCVEDDRLVIEGERRHDIDPRQAGAFYRSECSYGTFRREIPLPEPVEHDHVKAKFKNGVLEVAVPRAARESTRREVRIES